jgi:Icc-related predicted phosphoesterase
VFWRKKDKAANGEVKMFFASDLHGSNVCFKKFINSAKFYGADVLVLGGDLTGKAVIPIAEPSNTGSPCRSRAEASSTTSSSGKAISASIRRSCQKLNISP